MTPPSRERPDANSGKTSSEAPHIKIRPGSSPLAFGYLDVWRHRDLLWLFTMRDVKLRYRQTALGGVWLVLGPLLTAGAFTFVFASVARLPSHGFPYFVFAFAGLLGWNVFSNGLTKAAPSMLDNSTLVSKVYFPRLLLPLAAVLSGLVDAFVGFVILLVLMAANNVPIPLTILVAPAWIGLLAMTALGTGFLVASLMVSFRDLRFVTPILVQLLLFASPVLYPSTAVPSSAKLLVQLNPLSALVEGTRSALIGTPAPATGRVLYSLVTAITFVLLGTVTFRATEQRFADVI